MEDLQELGEVSTPTNNAHILTKPKPVLTEGQSDYKPMPRTQNASEEFLCKADGEDDYTRLAGENERLKEAFGELRREFKVLSRENREQSLELREHKRQNTRLTEAYTKLQQELEVESRKLSKTERTQYMEHFDLLEDKAAYFRNEFRKREGHLSYLTRQTRDANNEKEAVEDRNRKLQQKIRELSENLTECRDDLLRLQPPSQTSDSEISEQYSNLCQQIAGWVDDKTEDPDMLETFFENLETVTDLPQSFRQDLTNRQFKFGKASPQCLPVLVQYLIHCRIREDILGPRIFIFGLDETSVALLQSIEEGMSGLEPRRDALTLRRWRSEALQGLLKMEAFAAEQASQAEVFAQSLCSALSPVLSTIDEDWKELLKQVVEPTIKLANAIGVSTTDYEFFSHLFSRPPGHPHAVHRNEIQHYQMVDNATHKIIRPDSNLKITDDGILGEEMFVVSPGMVRSQKDGAERVVLCKPTIVVKLSEPMGKRGRGIKSLGAWTSGWLGGGEDS